LSHDKSLAVFDLIAVGEQNREIILNTLRLTRKQYYSRISALIQSGLVEKINGKYSLTSLGEIVHDALRVIKIGIKDYWKLKAIDVIRVELPRKECDKIIQALIENQYIRELILAKRQSNTKKSRQESNTLTN
jgi:predicted transcriptional regulator